jgi:hypothetical protein
MKQLIKTRLVITKFEKLEWCVLSDLVMWQIIKDIYSKVEKVNAVLEEGYTSHHVIHKGITELDGKRDLCASIGLSVGTEIKKFEV